VKRVADPLVVECLAKSFGGLQALDQISLSLRAGERRALIGANGAGKTTLFHLISGVLAPSSGKILLFGRDATRMPVHKRAALGLARTFQITNLLPTLSVLENILLALQAREPCRFVLHRPVSSFGYLLERAQEILLAWGFWERKDEEVRGLSYGEQREIEIVMALAQRPKLLLLDEPAAGLSPAETARVASMVRNLPHDVTVLLIEHDMDVAFDLAESISVLHMGKLVAEGSPEEIRKNQTVQEIYLGSRPL
jgi:branched-chain amino acid transport system ATP-binding protein